MRMRALGATEVGPTKHWSPMLVGSAVPVGELDVPKDLINNVEEGVRLRIRQRVPRGDVAAWNDEHVPDMERADVY